MAGSIGWVNIRLQILFLLPTVPIEPLQKISLAIKQTDTHQWNAEIGCAFDVVAGKNA
jgi:hypothetical protein